MKRAGAILLLTLMISMLFGLTAFGAEDFKVVSTTPKNGDEGMSMENMGVKVTFSQPVYNEENEKFNSALCSLTDESGETLDCRVIFNEKKPEEVLILAVTETTKRGQVTNIKGDTKYTMTIQPGFLSADGQELPQQFSVTFKTLNPKTTTTVSIGMMALMMGAMVFAMRKGANQTEEDKTDKLRREANEKINPYKIAKETGRPVEEIIAEEQKRQEKIAAKLRRKEEKEAKEKAKIDKYRKEKKIDIASGDNLRVPGPRPISEYSDYKAPVE